MALPYVNPVESVVPGLIKVGESCVRRARAVMSETPFFWQKDAVFSSAGKLCSSRYSWRTFTLIMPDFPLMEWYQFWACLSCNIILDEYIVGTNKLFSIQTAARYDLAIVQPSRLPEFSAGSN